jgi:uncharacterized Zn finger protein (UPF0148 family)
MVRIKNSQTPAEAFTDTRPCPACGATLRPDDTHWSLFPEPMGGYVCPAVTAKDEAEKRPCPACGTPATFNIDGRRLACAICSKAPPTTSSYRVEVRKNADGTIDEVLLYDAERCLFHMEQMSKRSWWFGLYRVEERHRTADEPNHSFNVYRTKKRVVVSEQ